MRRLFVATVALLLATAIAWWRIGAAPTAEPRAAAAPTTPAMPAQPVVPKPADPIAALAQKTRTAQPSAEFVARRAALTRSADAGSIDASAEAGRVLLACDGYVDIPADLVDTAFVEIAARLGADALGDVPPDDAADYLHRHVAREKELCDGASNLALSADERRRALEWLDHAAQAGDTQAMIDYARYAFRGYDSPGKAIADLDGARERRRVARAHLTHALASGNIDALEATAESYAAGTLFERDDVLAYAHFFAFLQISERRGLDTRGMNAQLRDYAKSLDAAAIERARQRAQTVLAACCAAGAER